MKYQNIAVIGAMDIEIAYLVSQLENKTESEQFGYTFYSGVLCGRQVTILKCGIGKVNAARGTQLVIDRFAPDAVLTESEEAMAALGELSGRTVRDDITEQIFARFCVGK